MKDFSEGFPEAEDFFREFPAICKGIHDLARDAMHDRNIEMMLVGFEFRRSIAARFSILKRSAGKFQCFTPMESEKIVIDPCESDDAIKQKIVDAFVENQERCCE